MNDTLNKWLEKIDVRPMDVPAAFALLTRIPVPVDHVEAGERASRATWAYPIVGAVLGLFAGIIALFLSALGLPSGMSAAAGIGVLMFATGALHEDGIADCADGFGGGNTIERSLEIMKDSRIGAFGAATLMVVLLARWSGYQAVIDVDWLMAFIAVGAASRLPMVLVMYGMPLARPSGLAARVGLVTAPTAVIAILVTLIICISCIGLWSLPVIAVAILATLPLCWLAWRKIEGYTGDVLGGCQQIAEIAALATAASVL